MNLFQNNLLLSFLLLGMFCQAQINYQGEVIDLGTQMPVENVKVCANGSGFHSFTNNLGQFSISINANANSNSHVGNFSVHHAMIAWDLPGNVQLDLYSVDGRSLFSKSEKPKGMLQLLVPADGYYFLIVTAGSEQMKFGLYSSGTDFYIVKSERFSNQHPVLDSSISFSNPDYFSREFLLTALNDKSTIGLLKKAYDSVGYFEELLNYEAFLMLHSSPPITNYGEVKAIKAMYDFVDDKIYYFNINKYPSHHSFAADILGYDKGDVNFLYSQYGNYSSRFLNLVSINYHKKIDKYVFQFSSIDLVDCEGVLATYNKIQETSYLGDKLYFYPNNQRWDDCEGYPAISSEELFFGQNYQPMNLEECYGFLRKVTLEELPNTYLGRHDVVLVNGIPNDLSLVSGIITTEFQTALSHINILSHNRQTPNMALIDGWTNPCLDTLMGALVYLKVAADSFEIRRAGLDEAEAFWEAREPHTPIVLEKDLETSGLIDLANESYESVKTIGGKAANFSEMVNLGSIPLPENYFAIPFYYYQQHMIAHGLDQLIDDLLVDDEFFANLEYRTQKLEELRASILGMPIDDQLVLMVEEKIDNFQSFPSFRFRSSTNAEDLEGFSGAGLYDSYSAKKDHQSKTIANAIRKVWASLWNIRAFDEREYFKIDHHSVAMGILVHRSFPDEDANGVVVTKNLYNNNHAYTINTQYKEYSIVYPEPGILHDQILTYTISLENADYTIEYLTHSNIPELGGNTVLSDEEIFELADYCTEIKIHYFENISTNPNCEYDDFAVDLEFKVDSQVGNRKIYIKQVRIY
jgi:hypothetical protein